MIKSPFKRCPVLGKFHGALPAVVIALESLLILGVYEITERMNGDTRAPFSLMLGLFVALCALAVNLTLIRAGEKSYRDYISRLKLINEVNRQVSSTLETDQAMALLGASLQRIVAADTYFFGVLKGDEIHLELFYDEGETYRNVCMKDEGTLSGWVVRNQRSLFLPDLTRDKSPEGVRKVIIGNPNPSRSWMGMPFKTSHISGILAVASYHPNAFEPSDMELLSTLAQQASMSLENASLYAQTLERARLDSLTGVYNHVHFVDKLQELAQRADFERKPFSLIMLDLDHFKIYNDLLGHQVGDRVILEVCNLIRRHVKRTDAVGRWGGEELAIAMPYVNGAQATVVAERIRAALENHVIELAHQNNAKIPAPTVSQGIAVYPDETDDIFTLVNLADHRIYCAKEGGRNRIEPNAEFWISKGVVDSFRTA